MDTPTTKLKAGQTAWIMENNKPTQIKIYRVKVVQESAASSPDTWGRYESYMSLRPDIFGKQQETNWYDSSQIHATKEELLASL